MNWLETLVDCVVSVLTKIATAVPEAFKSFFFEVTESGTELNVLGQVIISFIALGLGIGLIRLVISLFRR